MDTANEIVVADGTGHRRDLPRRTGWMEDELSARVSGADEGAWAWKARFWALKPPKRGSA